MINLAERHQFILNKLQNESYLNVVDLCKELEVSSVTIRKDLKHLESRNLLFRTHGGATLNNPNIVERTNTEKEQLHSLEKQNIGVAAAALLKNNDSVVIASGTTVLSFVAQISTELNLTVVTSSLKVAFALLDYAHIEITQLGGVVRKNSSSVTGANAEQVLEDFYFNNFFLGVDGIDIDFGITTTNASEAILNRKMIKASNQVVVLADSTKFGKRGFGKICSLEEIDHIITDKGISDQMKKHLENLGVKVTIV